MVERVLNGGQRSANALVARDLFAAGGEGHVEIHADEDALAVEIEIANGELGHKTRMHYISGTFERFGARPAAR